MKQDQEAPTGAEQWLKSTYHEIHGGVGTKAPNFRSINHYNSATDFSISLKCGTAYRVWSRQSRYTANIQGQGVKGQGHNLT